jgi:hypothetical protein
VLFFLQQARSQCSPMDGLILSPVINWSRFTCGRLRL